MATNVKELAKQAVDELAENEVIELLDFLSYLRWRHEETDQSWFWSDPWQARYKEAKEDLAQGRFQDFDNIDNLLAELKR
jgi:uncharacterized protein (DUF2342 family)